MHEIESAYVAGILDGEGCLYARLVNRESSGNVEFRVTVQVCSAAMIERLRECFDLFGVEYRIELGRMMERSKRPAYKIDVCKRDSVEMLLWKTVRYMVVKRAEARLMLEWLGKYPANSKPPRQEREAIVLSIKQAKKVA